MKDTEIGCAYKCAEREREREREIYARVKNENDIGHLGTR